MENFFQNIKYFTHYTTRFQMLKTKVISPTSRTHSATVIFFHGSGDNGENLIEWVRFLLGRDMEFPHIKIIYPTAPLQPYTPADGAESNVWFDRKSISIEARESRSSLAKIYLSVGDLLKKEIDSGIPPHRIIVGGFSMGGALAIHTGYHINQNVGGVFACSSFINRNSIVYEHLKTKSTNDILPELLMFHGGRDMLVPIQWGTETFKNLTELQVKGEFIPLKNTLHELKTIELTKLEQWINEKLPPIESDLQNKL